MAYNVVTPKGLGERKELEMLTNWKITVEINGFKTVMLVEGTESEMLAYLESEFRADIKAGKGYVNSYTYVGVGADLADVLSNIGIYRYQAPQKDQ